MKTSLALIALLASTTTVAAGTIDFESGFNGPTTTFVGNEFPGITFTSDDGLRVVKVGEPDKTSGAGFKPNNTPEVDALGNYFLTGSFKGNAYVGWEYADNTKVTNVTFNAGDFDGGLYRNERWRIRAFDRNGDLISKQIFKGSQATDANVLTFDFSGDIGKIDLFGKTRDGKRNIGYFVDNIDTTIAPVPLPATMGLMLLAIAGLFGWRKLA